MIKYQYITTKIYFKQYIVWKSKEYCCIVSLASWKGDSMNLSNVQIGQQYTIRHIGTDDEALNSFLFTLGCYSGEPITVVSRKRASCTVAIKDGRYGIDRRRAAAISVE